jgi:hypothetical protein
MKFFFAALTFLALFVASTFMHANSGLASTMGNLVQNSSSNLILISGHPNDLEGWVDIAPIGSTATTVSQTGEIEGLVHLPFGASGNTKIIVNMDYAGWVFTSGTTTQVKTLGTVSSHGSVQEEPQTLLLSGIKQDRLAEVHMTGDSAMIPMDGPDNYVLNARLLRWAKIPDEARVSIVQ